MQEKLSQGIWLKAGDCLSSSLLLTAAKQTAKQII